MSALPQERRRLSAAEYLAGEETAEVRSEYWNGEVFAMAGASPEHETVNANLIGAAWREFQGRPCRVWTPNLRVLSATGLYTYPDVALLCGTPEFVELPGQGIRTLVNPSVLIEVLSESTERSDRGFKFQQYRSLPSLREYVLVHQDQPMVEVHVRQPDNSWTMFEYLGLDAEFPLASVGIRLRLRDVYRNVEFTPQAPADEIAATAGTDLGG